MAEAARRRAGEICVGDGDYASGWPETAQREAGEVAFNRAGLPTLAATLVATGVAITLATLDGLRLLGPAMHMQCRARLPGDVLVVNEQANAYRKEHSKRRQRTHVNLRVQADKDEIVCMWVARIVATHVLTGDESRARDGTCSRAALRHDGVAVAGMIVEPDANCNYMAEIAAILDGLAGLPPGSRAVLMLDATSPVHALIKFRKSHARRRAGYYCVAWFDTLEQLLVKLEAVVSCGRRRTSGRR